MNILVVDDIAINRKLLRVTLEAEGHETLEAADGIEALAVLERETVDAVISDILMPNMDGFRLCQEVRKSDRLHTLPFIFYTATYNSPEDVRLAKAIGGDKYLAKPATTATLLQTLHDVTHKSGTQSAGMIAADEVDVLKQYNQALIHKLEQKNTELQQTLELHQRAHERIVELNSSLQRRVQERTTELEQTHKRLLDVSRQGGMAEIAANVIHQVGNVLNSVNVSANLVIDSVKNSKAGSLAKAAALLREHESDLGAFMTGDPRGVQLPTYLVRLAEHLIVDQDATVKELELLCGNIAHIKKIVAMQQSYARVSGVTEMVKLTELVDDSLRMNVGAPTLHTVEVVREFEDVPPINVERHKALQIIGSLVSNARHACNESGRPDGQMTVRVANSGIGVEVSVSDNGVGIAPENLARIFNHGFSTRKEGHGFGLHSGALAAKEMGGSLNVHSEGLGKGATFTLELPLRC